MPFDVYACETAVRINYVQALDLVVSSSNNTGYVGRFAPSPTGPLHLGSLISALGSWADAKHHNGQWLVRIEDIDPPRETPQAAVQIIESLNAHQLYADKDVSYQHMHSQRYDNALENLRQQKKLYACTCTRKSLRALNQTNYPGTCRSLNHAEEDFALRVMVEDKNTVFEDLLQGSLSENVSSTIGDFIVRRRGPFYAYQLAVVVDDAAQGVTHVVRGSDLLDNTARQIALQQHLDYTRPQYLHLPLARQKDGRKLSKQTGAEPLDNTSPLRNLRAAWSHLGQTPAPESINTCEHFLAHCRTHWNRASIPLIAQ